MEFWGEPVRIVNRAPMKSSKGVTPFEAWHGRMPDVAFLRTFGCVSHVKNVKPHLGKLEDRSTHMVFLGYEEGSKAYRSTIRGLSGDVVFDESTAERVHVLRDVVFDESTSWSWEAMGAEEDGRGRAPSPSTTLCIMVRGKLLVTEARSSGGQAEQEAAEPQTPPSQPAAQGTPSSAGTDGSVRFITPPPGAKEYLDTDYDDEPFRFRTVDNIIGDASPPGQAVRDLGELFMASAEEPSSLEAAEADARKRWRQSRTRLGCKPIGLKWVYKVKKNERGDVVKHKARFVAKGREGIDFEDVFAPVAQMDSMRLLLAVAATRDWTVHHLDVKSAFLNGELTEVVFVRQPPGFVLAGEERKVLCLRKALYGLRQEPRAWNIKLDSTLATLGLKKGTSEHALYTWRSMNGLLIVGVYVDDLIVTGSEQQEIKKFKSEMAAKFKMSDLGLLTYYHGIEVGEARHRALSECLCTKTAGEGWVKGLQSYPVPMQEKPNLSKNSTDKKVDTIPYRSLIGGPRYLTHTRPDIAFAVGYKDHEAAVKHLLRYIAGRCELGLAYPRRKKTSELEIIGFSDSDMGATLMAERAPQAWCFSWKLAPSAGNHRSRKLWLSQPVRLSILLVQLPAATCHGVWLRMLEEVTGQALAAPILRIDNKSAIELAKNPIFHNRSKHIDIKFHFIRDCMERKQVILEQVGTDQQLADVFTKPLEKNNFKKMKTQVGMVF
ncbi:LOW QUALITY PROTEIN: hypothetical protein U9M48_013354 [Paspalum notatum var. saurae]|uniref:Reverse transcriptase Ty1/copia-type domain-containing protein n=1 Tax=Paspalum notatum var. saurae TaxID=547442 RepID=A0AAQ3WJM9_PASNO